MFNEYSKYRLFRKYITEDGVNYTPLDEYQALVIGLNQCDCGYKEYDYRYVKDVNIDETNLGDNSILLFDSYEYVKDEPGLDVGVNQSTCTLFAEYPYANTGSIYNKIKIYFTAKEDTTLSIKYGSNNMYRTMQVYQLDSETNGLGKAPYSNIAGNRWYTRTATIEIPKGKHFLLFDFDIIDNNIHRGSYILEGFDINMCTKYELWEEYEKCSNTPTGNIEYRNINRNILFE